MTVESNYVIAIATLGDWLKRLAPAFQPMRSKMKTMSGLSWLLVLYSAPRGFSPGSPVLPSPQKSTFPNSNSIRCRTSRKSTFERVELPG